MANEGKIEKREGGELVQAEHTRGGRVYRPHVDIIEQSDELLLLADVPGARAEDVEVNVERGVLSVYARVNPRQDEDSTHYLFREYGVGGYARSFQVGEGVDAAGIEAKCADGVLTLRLPKAAALKPKKIAVKKT